MMFGCGLILGHVSNAFKPSLNLFICIAGISRQRTHSSSRSDEENETSLSDDLNTSWPVVGNKKGKTKKSRPSSVIRRSIVLQPNNTRNTTPVRFDVSVTNQQISKKSRRKRERERFYGPKKVTGFGGTELVRSAINGTILGTADERPKTATLKRPSVLDESLKDKVNVNIFIPCTKILKYYYYL